MKDGQGMTVSIKRSVENKQEIHLRVDGTSKKKREPK